MGLRALDVCFAPSDRTAGGCRKCCTRRQKSWVLISLCDQVNLFSLSLSFPPCEQRGLNKRILRWEQETGIHWAGTQPRCSGGSSSQPVVSNILASWGSSQNRLDREPQGPASKGSGAPGIPWAPEGSCSGGKQVPLWLWGAWAPRAVQLSSTRVVNRSRRVGGAAVTLSHSLAPREGRGGRGRSRG